MISQLELRELFSSILSPHCVAKHLVVNDGDEKPQLKLGVLVHTCNPSCSGFNLTYLKILNM
jgi:hypothetical protein